MSTVIPFPSRDDRPARMEPSHLAASDVSSTTGRAVWTVKETAEMLSLSLGSTYALIRSGQIPAMKLGGRWVVPKRRFQEWLDNLPTEDDVCRHAVDTHRRPPTTRSAN